MDEGVKLFDISEFEGANFWIVNLIPFGPEERDFEKIKKYQENCVKNKIFGMGWQFDCIFEKSVSINDSNAKNEFINKYTSKYGKDSKMEKALNSYEKIKKGDFVIMRLKNSHIYIGRISEPAKYNSNYVDGVEENRLSWYCEVEKWMIYENITELPSEIIGRLSLPRQPTICPISERKYRQQLLIISAYWSKQGRKDLPKVTISKNNFCRSMEYKLLEDLVCMYIYQKHNDYILLPSSCKVSQQKYEYIFIKNGAKSITCQVKNQADIVMNNYLDEKSFEKIYLFSGEWSDDKAIELQKEFAMYSNIEIINPSELYTTLKDCDYLKEILDKYYKFSDIDIQNFKKFVTCLENRGWVRNNKLSRGNCYRITDETIYFKSHNLWYWKEFNALFAAGKDVLDDADTVKKLIDEILASKEYNEV